MQVAHKITLITYTNVQLYISLNTIVCIIIRKISLQDVSKVPRRLTQDVQRANPRHVLGPYISGMAEPGVPGMPLEPPIFGR